MLFSVLECASWVHQQADVENKLGVQVREIRHQKIHYNPYQNTNGIFRRARTNNPKMCMKVQKTPDSKSNIEKEQSLRYHSSQFQTIQQSHSNQNSMLLAQKKR